MKLFQKLLLAPAVIGLLTPIATNASETNYSDVNSYSHNNVDVSLESFKPLSNKNPLLAGGEGLSSGETAQSDFDTDSFSSTTSASFVVNIAAGSVDTGADNENLGWNFDWELATSTSYTGNDSLDVVLNAGVSKLMPELDMTNSAGVTVDSISYTTALGEKSTFFVGNGAAAGSSLYNVACVYGAQTDTLSDCGISSANVDEEFGTAAGASFDVGNGFAVALAYEGQGMTSKGLLSDAGADAFGAQVSYSGDSYGISLSWANIENHDSDNALTGTTGSTQSRGVNAYYTPDLDNFPSISVGFETNHDDTAADSSDQTSHYFVGLQWDEFGDGSLGAAFGSKAPYAENGNAETMYEIFYSYNYADGITITPIFYGKENAGSTQDETGLIVKSTFNF
tara:strand:- start:92 stop:1279 length:1188 start_codon:yes stop_codon:yes gene_type:complete